MQSMREMLRMPGRLSPEPERKVADMGRANNEHDPGSIG